MRYKVLTKWTIALSVSPPSRKNITIAPDFNSAQVDLADQFKVYTLHNQCKTIKVWICVFWELQYSSFIPSFMLFVHKVEYPKKFLLEERLQLLSGCDLMKISFADLKGQLHSRIRVEYEVCPSGANHIHG